MPSRQWNRRHLGALLAPLAATGLAACLPGEDGEATRVPPGASSDVPLNGLPDPEATGTMGTMATAEATPQPTAAPTEAPAAIPAVPTETPLTLPLFYSPRYVLAGHSFETTRKARWVLDSIERDPIPPIALAEPEPLAEADVSAMHDPGYVTAVRTGNPRSLAQSQGFPWDTGLWLSVLASNGGVVAAALAAFAQGSAAGSLSSGLHHAHRTYGSGYCTFNGLALAARALLAAGAKSVLILDLDAHCGGGTNELVGALPNVWHVDVAVHAFDSYKPAPRQTLDLVQAPRNYLPTIRRRLEALAGRTPPFDVCLYNAGMDPYERCPVGGLSGITREVLAERERLVFGWARDQGIPVAFALAGGYLGPGLNQVGLANLHRLTLEAAAANLTV